MFVSRKEKKIFVRQGFVPLFDMPIVIDAAGSAAGHARVHRHGSDRERRRHALERHDRSRLQAIGGAAQHRDAKKRSKEPPNSASRRSRRRLAAEALDRIQMPQEAVERIGELLIPGSSLVVSDEGLGRETGRYTEFIVLTH